MRNGLAAELDYQYRCLRLGWGFLTGRFIHCNLQLTYRCDLKCQICDFWKTEHRADEELTLEQVRVIGRKLNQLGSLIISLAGGEPVLRSDLREIITILRDGGHFPIMITNGWNVDENRARGTMLNAAVREVGSVPCARWSSGRRTARTPASACT